MSNQAKKQLARMNLRVIKSETKQQGLKQSEQLQNDNYANEWLEPEYNLQGLSEMVSTSSILPQCTRAYKMNIAGFGIDVKYKIDEDETSEKIEEFERLKKIIETLTLEMDTKEVFEKLIENRETYGIAYIEVIKNIAGEVVEIIPVDDVSSIKKTKLQDEYVEISNFYDGEEIQRTKRFCKYKQEKTTKTVYFKEFDDPRVMDRRTGKYLNENETLELKYHANEIFEIKIGSKPYGEVRWIGQSVNVYGSRKAENLNNNYFENGRHTPLMISVTGGTLSEESYTKLQEYMNNIKGEAGQHAFILLEVDSDSDIGFEDDKKPNVEIKSIADVLQKDELFQEYLNNNRKKVQSAFLLPDIYVAYSGDYNRATAQVAQELTEKQVFQPERKSLAWLINNKLLNCYNLKHCEVYFKAPDISNTDDLIKLISTATTAGAITPNKAKEVVYRALGDVSEDYDGDYGNIPLVVSQTLTNSLNTQIEKAEHNHENDEIISIMKSVRNLLIDLRGEQDEM